MVKLIIGLSALVVGGLHYLSAAPVALAESSLCQAGNYSDACPITSDNSSAVATPSNVYTNAPAQKAISVPEPGTVAALLLTGAGIIYSGKKRKQADQER